MKFIIFLLLTSCLPESKKNNDGDNNDEGSSSLLTSSSKISFIEDLKQQIPTSNLSNKIDNLSTEYNNLLNDNSLEKIKIAKFLFNTYNFIKNNINNENEKTKLLKRYGINFSNISNLLLEITNLLIENSLSYTGDHKITFFSNKFTKEENFLNLFSSYKSNSILYAIPAYKNAIPDGDEYKYYYSDPVEISSKTEIVMMKFSLKNQAISIPSEDPNTLVVFKGNKKDLIDCFDVKIENPHSCLTSKGSIKLLTITKSN